MIGIKEKVKKVLMEYPETRNSDIALTIQVWRMFYGVDDVVNVKQLYDLPREDNIKRIRASFCQKGRSWAYPTKLIIAKKRSIAEDIWRQMLGYPTMSETYYPTHKGSYTEKIILSDKAVEDPSLKQNKLI